MTIKAFGYTFYMILFKRSNHKPGRNSGPGIQADGFKLKMIDRYLFAVDPNGEPFPKGQISCKVNDRVNEISTVTITAPFAGFFEATP